MKNAVFILKAFFVLFRCHNLVNRQLQWHEVIAYNKNITREIFFFKNHAESEAGRLVSDLFLVL